MGWKGYELLKERRFKELWNEKRWVILALICIILGILLNNVYLKGISYGLLIGQFLAWFTFD